MTVSAVVTVTAALLRRRVGGALSRWRLGDHVVVAGSDRSAARVAAGMRATDQQVVLISDAPDAAEAAGRGVSVVFGHPVVTRHLDAARVDRAAEVIVMMENDSETTGVALTIARRPGRGRVLGLLRDPDARSHLQARILRSGGRPVELIALPEVAARRALSRLAPHSETSRINAVFGTGPLAEALAIGIARLTWVASGTNRPKLIVAEPVARRLSRIDGIAERVELAPAGGDAWEMGALLAAEGGEGRCYLCPPASICDALAVTEAAGDRAQALLLMEDPSEEVARYASETLAAADDRGGIMVIDVSAGAVGPELLSYGMIEEVARAKHEQYLRDGNGSVEATRPWEDLTPELQRANRHFALGLMKHLERTGRRLAPSPGLGSSVGLAGGIASVFAADEIEDLARAEHDRWMRDKLDSGWRYAPTRSDPDKRHPSLVPWEQLDEPTRDLDRGPIRGVGRILAEAGLRAERVDEGR